MKNFKLNLKGLYGYRQSLLSRSPQPRDNREMSERRPSEERTLLAPITMRFARYVAMLIMLLTLGVGQMWGDNIEKDAQIYFDNSVSNWSYNSTYFVINDEKGYKMSAIDRSKLYYHKRTAGTWSGYSGIRLFAAPSSWGDNDVTMSAYGKNGYQNMYDNCSNLSNWYGASYGFGSLGYHFIKLDKTGSKTSQANISVKYNGTKPTCTSTAKIRTRNSYDNSYSTVSTGTWPATVNMEGTYWSGDNASGHNNAATNSGASGTYTNMYTGLVEMSVSSLSDQYTFDGWATSEASSPANTDATYSYYITNNTTVYAYFTKKWTITFDKNGHGDESTPSTQYVAEGKKISAVSDLSEAGYTFGGWYTNEDCTGSAWNFSSSTVSEDITLYAKWTPTTTTITLNKNAQGGSTVSGAASVTATYDAALPLFTALSSTNDYALTGYWTAESGGTKIINANGTLVPNVTISTTPYTGADGIWKYTSSTLILYAQWSLDRTLTYDGNGATSGTVPAAATSYANGTNVTVLGNTGSFAKTGYSFAGWNTAEDGLGTSYAAGSTITMSANYTLYAQWTENKRNVTISVSPSGAGTLNRTSASVGVATTTTVTATAYPGYKFTGWTATNCSVEPSSSASTTLSGNGTTGDATLVANFVRTYAFVEGRFQVKNAARTTTTYTGTSGNTYWSTDSRNIEFEYDETNHRFFLHTHMQPKELAAQLSSNTQYFTIQTSTSEATLTGGSLYTPASTSPTSAQQLSEVGLANKKATSPTENRNASFWFTSSDASGYALLYFDEAGVWYELEQSLKYDANGGSGDAPTPAYYLKGTNASAASNPFTARANYTFGGWNTDQYITGTSYAEGSDVPMNTNRMLYAKWDRTVTLEQEGATTEGSTTVIGTWNCATLPAITNPEKIGYTFGGWYTEVAGAGNLIIDTEGVLQADKTNWTDASGRFQRTPSVPASESKPLYAKWTQTVTLNANTGNHGSGDNTSATIVYNATAKTSITHCTPATGYHLVGYYTAATDGTKVLNVDGSFAAATVTDYITDSKWTKAGATTLFAHYEPNTYDVILDFNGATTGSNQTVTATFDADMPTTQKGGSTPISAPSKTGYTFGGYYANSNGTGTQYYTSGLASNHVWDVATNNTTIYAKWTANPYTVTLNINEANHGTIDGKATSASVTFDAAPTAIAADQLPTAAEGYAFMGFFTAAGGEGVQVINANGTWIASVTGYTDDSGHWILADVATLYAYYKKAEITALMLDNAVVAPGGEVGVTPRVEPTPTGTNSICWKLLYSNGNLYSPQPTFSPASPAGISNKVTFTAPPTSGMYLIAAVLRTGNECNGGTKLDSVTSAFQVAGDHTVTVQYKCGDEVIRASASVTGKPLEATEITAPDIVGYTFSKWKAGDGITIEGADSNGENTSATINFTAIYDGKLTAIYTKKQMIYFNNTLEWEHVYVYFYKDGNYWGGSNQGTGTDATYHGNSYTGIHGEMTKIGESNIYYYDMTANSATSYTNVAFTSKEQNNAQYFYDGNNVVGRDDYSASLSMYVPLAGVEPEAKNGIYTAYYYQYGYWMNYPESTGYTLKIYNKKEKANDSDSKPEEIRSIPFEFTADKTMPMELDVDLEAGKTYGFKIYCNNDTWLGNDGTMTATTPNWELSAGTSNCGLQTTAAGNYKFTLNYFAVGSTDYTLRIGVTYPVAAGDYQVLYQDDTMSEWFISSVVPAASDKDTVSFFVRKDKHPVLKLQKCGSVGEGTVTWSDTVANLISVLPSAITQDSVYIFCLNKNAEGKRELGDVKAYTGNYYIRTDCAGTTKWDNYRAADHLMTYSEYSEKNSDFTHYFVQHVNSNTNVKYVIANDYSPNISDTLAQQDGDVSTTPAYTHVNTDGFLQANANIRFMWNRHNNNVVRAYLADAQTDGLEFLVLRANSSTDMTDADGNALLQASTSEQEGYNHGAPNNSIQFTDNENWIYEANIKIKPGAFVKLYAKFDNGYFYFKGNNNDDFSATEIEGKPNAIQLMEGTGDLQKVRVVFDFKTDRLLAAWVPEDATIETEHKINADVMFVREGQGDVAQLTFGSSGKISAIKSAYGVMRFNKWTLNNKDKDTHTVLSSPASIYERSLFWISFPFKVKLNDVFGFGTYGTHWAIQKYNGVRRAAEGFWAESSGFWEWMDRNTEYLEPNQGYLLAIDLDLLGEDNTAIWGPDSRSEQIELYFPSYGTMPDITSAAVEHTLPSHACTIDWSGRSNGNGGTLGSAYNRTVIDSHWNVMSVPTYVNTENIEFTDNDDWITEAADGKHGPNFLYTWNMDDNTLTPTAGEGYHYHAMHAYMVQYHGKVTWTASSGSPYPIVARRTYAEQPKKVNFCLEIQQNEKMIDRTFVQLSDDEEVSAEFNFGEDMGKEFNSRKANIYTVIENYLPAAGNTLPMSDQTTLVPVGVKTTAAGEYTFAMPEGTSGVSVVLIDNIAGTRTNLALSDYTVALGKGDLSDRFMLEIAPIKQMPTDIENVQGGDVQGTKVRKVMVDGILYIVKDGKVFDARGAKVK